MGDDQVTEEARPLTAARVEELFIDCLYGEDEDMTGYVEVDGILNPYGLHPGRLESHRVEVAAMLMELPLPFRKTIAPDENGDVGGGGWSFLNAYMDRHDRQWTGLHQTQEQLIVMGIGLGLAEYLLGREAWAAFPGGVPYLQVDDEACRAALA